jgi:hypothetical protein
MSISQNFTNEYPALSVDFAKSQKLDSRISFVRSTSGAFIDETGRLISAAANTPRFCFDFKNGKNLLNTTEYLSTWGGVNVGGTVKG